MRLATIYGKLPQDILNMPYRHFLLSCRHSEQVERDRAFYMAAAFHDPEKLTRKDGPAAKQDYQANRRRLAQLLGAKREVTA